MTKKKTTRKKTTRKTTGKPTPAPKKQNFDIIELLSKNLTHESDQSKLELLINHSIREKIDYEKQQFQKAFTDFSANCPEIEKDQISEDGTYYHATLGHLTKTLKPSLAKHGLTFRWYQDQDDAGCLYVTCVLTHIDGHSESTTLKGYPDDSGGLNMSRAVAATNTLLERYTLLAVLGMAPMDDDTDGTAMTGHMSTQINEKRPTGRTISKDQVKKINSLIDEYDLNRFGFLTWMRSEFDVQKIEQIPAAEYQST
ncbi:MAG: hypothetical protein DWP95_10260, partial [Proteobacteria bacterium]